MNKIVTKWLNFISEGSVEEQPPEKKPAEGAGTSAGVLLYKKDGENIFVYLVHAGGPYNENKRHAWGIPKGGVESGENIRETAIREFQEEMGIDLPGEISFDLGSIKTKSGKVVYGFACEGDLDEGFEPESNKIDVVWKGQQITIPEIDKGGWFSVEEAKNTINVNQAPFIDRLKQKLEQKNEKDKRNTTH